MSEYPRAAAWLSVHRVAWIVNSSSSSMSDQVQVRAQSRRWAPAWLARYAICAHFGYMYASRASTHRLERLTRSKPTVAGTVKWEGRFTSAPPVTTWGGTPTRQGARLRNIPTGSRPQVP